MAKTEIDGSQIQNQSITNDDISLTAAIAGTKISPNFGSQGVSTSGLVSTGSLKVGSSSVAGQVLTATDANGNVVFGNAASEGVTDHGALLGLGDDDHTQYLNNTRGDARYVQPGYRMLPTPTSLYTSSGTFISGVSGEQLDAGSAVYMKADGKFWKANAAAAATTPALGIARSAVFANDAVQVMTYGLWSNDNLTWTPGQLIYLSNYAGDWGNVAPSATGEQVQILGVAVAPSVFLFNPNLMVIGL